LPISSVWVAADLFIFDATKLPTVDGIGEFACRSQPVLPFQMANVVSVEDCSIQNPNAFGGQTLKFTIIVLNEQNR
jgi:hypothetical protein